MDKDKIVSRKIKKEFYRLTGIFPIHRTNLLKEKEIRKDIIFVLLAEKVFDHPALLGILSKKIKDWLSRDKSEFTCCLAGYIYYLKEDFSTASTYFLNAIRENPQNLDNWFDLAFSLYHQGLEKHNLGKFILFHYDDLIDYFSKGKERVSLVELARLKSVLF